MRVLLDLPPPRLVLVRKPQQLRVEHAHQPLAFRAELDELTEEGRRVAADDDHLRAWRVAWRRDEPDPRQQLDLTVDGYVLPGRL